MHHGRIANARYMCQNSIPNAMSWLCRHDQSITAPGMLATANQFTFIMFLNIDNMYVSCLLRWYSSNTYIDLGLSEHHLSKNWSLSREQLDKQTSMQLYFVNISLHSRRLLVVCADGISCRFVDVLLPAACCRGWNYMWCSRSPGSLATRIHHRTKIIITTKFGI